MFVGRKTGAFNPIKFWPVAQGRLDEREVAYAFFGAAGFKANAILITNARILVLMITGSAPKIARSFAISDTDGLRAAPKFPTQALWVSISGVDELIASIELADVDGALESYRAAVAGEDPALMASVTAVSADPKSAAAAADRDRKMREGAVTMAAKKAEIVARATANAMAANRHDLEAEKTMAKPINSAADQDVYLSVMPNSGNWSSMPGHLRKAIKANISLDEKPLFIITEPGSTWSGAIIGMNERLILIKSGVMGGLMSGSLGGARVATFYYRDITGIEFNAGFVNGVVEILTASYSGAANKDFWKGTLSSRNADANDPWTQSNTLPLSKLGYANAKRYFDMIRKSLAEAKAPVQQVIHTPVSQSVPAANVLDQLERLSKLHDAGVVTADEFATKKAELLARL